MKASAKLGWGLVLLVAVVHYDFWFWGDTSLVFGFVPISLAYHAALSLLAALAWTLVVSFSWPDEIEAWASGSPDGSADPAGLAKVDATTPEERP